MINGLKNLGPNGHSALPAYIGCIFLNGFIVTPWLGIVTVSELWYNLFGTKRMGLINWLISSMIPLVTFLMIKVKNVFSIKTWFLGAFLLHIPITCLIFLLPFFYSKQPESGNIYFGGMVAATIASSALFAVMQSVSMAFSGLLPDFFANALPTGMTALPLLFGFSWLGMWAALGKTRPFLILGLFEGSVVLSMLLAIAIYLRLEKNEFVKNRLSQYPKLPLVKVSELRKVFRKIWPYCLEICILDAASFFLLPTMAYGFTPALPFLKGTWGTAINYSAGVSNAFSRVFIHWKPRCFQKLFAEKNIRLILAINTAVSVAVLVPLWLFQTGNLGIPAGEHVAIDVVVFVTHVAKSFVSGYLFNMIVFYSFSASEKDEKQKTSLLMTFSFVVGNFIGFGLSYLVNLIN